MENLASYANVLSVLVLAFVCVMPAILFKTITKRTQTACICWAIGFCGGLIATLVRRCYDYLEIIVKLLEKIN